MIFSMALAKVDACLSNNVGGPTALLLFAGGQSLTRPQQRSVLVRGFFFEIRACRKLRFLFLPSNRLRHYCTIVIQSFAYCLEKALVVRWFKR